MKLISLSLLLYSSLLANTITFESAKINPKHTTPNGGDEILSFHNILKRSMKSVVNISTKTINHYREKNRLYYDPYNHEYFEERGRIVPNKQDLSLGSGVLLSKDGYIVTNHHVVQGADEIVVTFKDSDKEYIAKLIGSDKGSDLAVIKIDAQNLNPISLSHEEDIKVGDVVFAIGNPFGVGQTVTRGIVSALNKNHVGINQYENFIQTDASINPGNSGGALVDSRGALIGINSAILSKSGGNNGIGFAIPINMVKDVVRKLVQSGKVYRGFMGVNITDITKKLALLYKHTRGAIITDIEPNSPAQKANLQRGDLIYEVNGKKVDDSHDLQRLISSFSPNETVEVSIERENREIKKRLKLMSRDYTQISQHHIAIEGLYLSELTPQVRKENHIPNAIEGILVEDIAVGSLAQKSGFRPKDIIQQIENINIFNIEDIKNAFAQYKGKHKRIYINRGGVTFLLVTQ